MKSTLFIADLHLEEKFDNITNLFAKFIEEHASCAEALYILGDLFKFWAGDDDHSLYHEKIKNILKTLSASGVKVYLMPGNRDFLLGQTFANESNCTLIPDPHEVNIYGIPIMLTHGDLLCTNDILMKIFRAITRSKNSIKLFLKLPLGFRITLAEKINRHSGKKKSKKSARTTGITADGVAKILERSNAAILIHGHIHEMGIHETKINTKTVKRIVLGEWQQKENNATGNFLMISENGTQRLAELA